MLGVRRAVVVEELVVGADFDIDLVHILLNDGGQRVVVGVGGLLGLEEDVGVLGGAMQHRMLRVQGAGAECLDSIPVKHLAEVLVVPDLDLLDLMRGPEAVEEMDERNAALDGREVCDGAEVHRFLHARRAEEREPGLPTCVDVRVVAEDRERMGGQGSCRHVDDAGEQLARDLIHVRDHQQQALGSGVGGGQGTGRQRAVHSAGGTALRLHLTDPDRLAEQVLPAVRTPHIGNLGHDRRRGDRVDRRNLGKGIGYMRGSVVAVHGLHLSCHSFFLL